MGDLRNHRHHKHISFLHGLGEKAKHLAELAGTVKGIYDTGRTVYSLAQAASPYVLPLLAGL
jgi:hypothetical protein